LEETREELARLLALYRDGRLDEPEVVEAIERLELGGRRGRASLSPSSLVDTLDGFRAAEASGAETLARWAELSDDPALVGGLRTAAAREARHAALLEERVRELGGKPRAIIPTWLAAYNDGITDPEATDDERLAALVERMPDVDAAIAPLVDVIDSIDDDALTEEMLRAMCDDEVATLRWAHEAYAMRRDTDRRFD